MKTVGLDIGSYSIKAVLGVQHRSSFEVLEALEIANPLGALLPDSPQKRETFVQALKTLFESSSLPKQRIRVSLSESLVSTKIVRMPLLNDAELASAIQWQVEQHIPIPLDQMQYEYTVLRRSQSHEAEPSMDVLIIGVKKQVVESLADIFLDVDLHVEGMETETLALLRVVETIAPESENVALLHIGAASAVMTFVANRQFQFVHVMPIAGQLFSRSVESGLSLDSIRAEEYKRTYGLLPDQLEGKVASALSPIITSLNQEIQKALRFYSTQYPSAPLQRVFLSGGSLYLPNLLPTISPVVNTEIVPLELSSFPAIQFKTALPQTSRFSVAVGLAMKQKV